MIRRKKQQYRLKEPKELSGFIKTIIGISPWIVGIIFILIADYSGNKDWIFYAVLVMLLFPVLFILQKLLCFFDRDFSVIHIIVIVLIFLLAYNIFAPEDYLSKVINPEEYWRNRITTLEKNVKYNQKFLYDISTSISSKDYEKKYADMLYTLMNRGLSEDSAASFVAEIVKMDVKVEETLLKSLVESYNLNLRLLKEAKIEYGKIKDNGEQ